MTTIRLVLVLYAVLTSASKLVDIKVISGPDVNTVAIAESKGNKIYGGAYRKNTTFDKFNLPGKNVSSYFLCMQQQWINYDEAPTEKSHSAIKDIAVDSKDNVIAVGIFMDSVSFGRRQHKVNSTATFIFVVKYTEKGSYLWSQQYGDISANVAIADNDDIYLTAHCRDHPIGNNQEDTHQTVMLKYNSNGEFEGRRELETTAEVHLSFVEGFIRYIPRASCTDHSGNLIETGTTNGTKLNADKTVAYVGKMLYIRKRSDAGNVLWTQYALTESDISFTDVTVGNDNSIYAVGKYNKPFSWHSLGSVITFNKTKDYFNHAFVMKFDESGDVLWSAELLGEITSVSILVHNNSVVVVGQFTNSIATGTQTLKTDQYSRTFMAIWDQSAIPPPSVVTPASVSKRPQATEEPKSHPQSEHSSFPFTLLDFVGTVIALGIAAILLWMRTEPPTGSNNGTTPEPLDPRYDHLDLSMRVAEVIQYDTQYRDLAYNLDVANRWRKLGTQLGYKTIQLDWMERSNSPSKVLLREWEVKAESTVIRLVTALLAVGNETAADMVVSFVPHNKQQDTTQIAEVVHGQQVQE